LIPFAKSMLINIDLERKRIEVKVPEGLEDLN
jgi:ribosomal 30S subunit maturation factor RimM